MITDYVSIKAAISEWQSWTLNESEMSMRDAYKAADDVAVKLSRKGDYVYSLHLMPVNGPSLKLHESVREIVAVAVSVRPDGSEECLKIRREIVERDEVCIGSTPIELESKFIYEVDSSTGMMDVHGRRKAISTHISFKTGESGNRVSPIAEDFSLARREQSAFGPSSVVPGLGHVTLDGQPRYRVLSSTDLEFDRPDYTWAIVCVLGDKIDEKGFRMLPDMPEAIAAAAWSIEERVQFRIFRKSKGRYGRVEMALASEKSGRAFAEASARLSQTSQDEWRSIVDGMITQSESSKTPSLGGASGDQRYVHQRKISRRIANVSKSRRR